jgi:hypothetical protein
MVESLDKIRYFNWFLNLLFLSFVVLMILSSFTALNE